MLIGIDARYGFRKQRRGIGVYIYNLLEELAKTADARYILYVDGLADPAVIEYFSRPPFTVHQIKNSNLFCWEQVLLPLIASRHRLDLLHCTANMAPLIKVCPTVITILDVIEFRRIVFGDTRLSLRHHLSRLYRVGLLPALARRADLVLTISEFSRQDIISVLKLSPAKVWPVYLGPPNKLSSGEGTGVSEEKFILALGAMDNRKNLGVLFEAFHLYKKAVAGNIRLLVAGVEKPELFVKKHNLANHPFSQEITCRGFVNDDELVSLYRQCACFVYPSLYEGFGLPPLEAMAAGAPVIASKATAVEEIVGGAGLFFDPHNPADLAEKIDVLLVDSDLTDDLKKRGRERLRFFSWEKCALETLAAYRKVYGHGWDEPEGAR